MRGPAGDLGNVAIVDADGTPRFVARRSGAIPVEYPESEREIHALLTRFAKARRGKLVSPRGRKATDLVTLLLKKRLFSSPAAFAHTVGVYREMLRTKRRFTKDAVTEPRDAAVCRPDQHWTDERVVVFTEYRDTQRWLAGLLNHCHRLVNYDIPFNPNKLEQRIGRIDRYGQRTPPDIRHFVGTGWNRAVDSYEADLEFLSRVATKVAQMESDLGKVNSVLSDAVTRRMLGDYSAVDVENAGGAAELVPTETRIGEQVRRLRESLDQTVRELGITPAGVKWVVDTALVLARQQPLRPHVDERSLAEGLVRGPDAHRFVGPRGRGADREVPASGRAAPPAPGDLRRRGCSRS